MTRAVVQTIRSDEIPVRTSQDVVTSRQAVRTWCLSIGMGIVDLTKLVTAASELARNAIEYGGGGSMTITELADGSRRGLQLTFRDHGPGIADIARAMTDGYTTGGGLGLGLSGSKRLVDHFEIESNVGEGTTISVQKWKLR